MHVETTWLPRDTLVAATFKPHVVATCIFMVEITWPPRGDVTLHHHVVATCTLSQRGVSTWQQPKCHVAVTWSQRACVRYNTIQFYHIIPEKWFVLFWMCDFSALTRCCKLVSFLSFIFAVLLANLIRPIICQIFEGSRELRHAPFRENFYRARSAFQRRFSSLAQAVLKICSIVWQNF